MAGLTERQEHAFAHPVHTPAAVDSGAFARHRRLAAGVLITILTVNR
jgi:hypothetical protein